MHRGRKVYDITRAVAPALAVWPGDTAYRAWWTARLEDGSPVNLGSVELSTHTGTHADAPLHYTRGPAIDDMPLLHYLGPCHVVHIHERREIREADVADLDLAPPARVLFRTPHSEVDDAVWDPDFATLDPGLVERLAERGVVLIGTDAPSVDPADSRDLPAHHALARHGVANLENLLLRDVPPGAYELIALPLRLVGMDAAPVRAVLRSL